MVIQPKTGKIQVILRVKLVYILPVGSVILPTVKLNGASRPISIEYEMVHGFNQAVFRT